MDGLFHGKPYFFMDDLGGFPLFLVQLLVVTCDCPICFVCFFAETMAHWDVAINGTTVGCQIFLERADEKGMPMEAILI